MRSPRDSYSIQTEGGTTNLNEVYQYAEQVEAGKRQATCRVAFL